MLNKIRRPSGGSVSWTDPKLGPILMQDIVPYVASTTTGLTAWNGSAWTTIIDQFVYNGPAFVPGNLREWNGNAWVS